MSVAAPEHALRRLATMSADLRSLAAEMEALVAFLRPPAQPARESEEFLTLASLCTRIGYAHQTIRNLISQGELRVGRHFVQKRRHGKIHFLWSAMERWLRERELDRSAAEPFVPTHRARTRKIR